MRFPAKLICFILTLLTVEACLGQDEGLFADFLTSEGAFTARLNFAETPRTVASFAGLAQGTIGWVDLKEGSVSHAPFFDGLTFHRVVKGFVIQGGSPAGDGSDGPGYSFPDEIVSTLKHDGAYVLSMANAGINSNGSQFFITLAATPFLDNKHTVFGKVITGQEVVDKIGQVSVGTRDKPVTPVIIESIRIRALGQAASAFDVLNQGVPHAATVAPLPQESTSPDLSITFPHTANSDLTIFRSENLVSWSADPLPLTVTSAITTLDLTPETLAVPQRFYRVSQVTYPDILLTPATLSNTTLDITFTAQGWKLHLELGDTPNAGTFTFNDGAPAAIVSANWIQAPYRGVLTLNFTPGTIVPMRLNLVYDTPTAGHFTGTVFQTTSFDASGTFTSD